MKESRQRISVSLQRYAWSTILKTCLQKGYLVFTQLNCFNR